MISEGAGVAGLAVSDLNSVPGGRQVIHAAHHKIFHDASICVEPSMDIDVACLNAGGKVRSRFESFREFELDPPGVDIFMRRFVFRPILCFRIRIMFLQGAFVHGR